MSEMLNDESPKILEEILIAKDPTDQSRQFVVEVLSPLGIDLNAFFERVTLENRVDFDSAYYEYYIPFFSLLVLTYATPKDLRSKHLLKNLEGRYYDFLTDREASTTQGRIWAEDQDLRNLLSQLQHISTRGSAREIVKRLANHNLNKNQIRGLVWLTLVAQRIWGATEMTHDMLLNIVESLSLTAEELKIIADKAKEDSATISEELTAEDMEPTVFLQYIAVSFDTLVLSFDAEF